MTIYYVVKSFIHLVKSFIVITYTIHLVKSFLEFKVDYLSLFAIGSNPRNYLYNYSPFKGFLLFLKDFLLFLKGVWLLFYKDYLLILKLIVNKGE